MNKNTLLTEIGFESDSRKADDVGSAVNFIKTVFREPRQFNVRFWNGTLLQGYEPNFTLILAHPGALRRMFRPPLELSLGEAFIQGDFDIEGNLLDVFKLFFSLIQKPSSSVPIVAWAWLALPAQQTEKATIQRGPARLTGKRHSKERDRAAVQYHYDVGNDFYTLWLDKRMVYSCAYFPTGVEDIDTAQTHKLDYICRKLRLKPGERLLDIGCGWGGLAVHAAQQYGVSVLGVTLSHQQQTLGMQRIADAGLSDRVEIRLLDYRDLTGGTFDKVVSVGMFEHVGRDHLPEYFKHVYRLLKPGGLFLNHGISATLIHAYPKTLLNRATEKLIIGSNSFFQRYIFPDGELVPLSEANLVAEQSGFEVRDVENLREHYALTLRQWVSRLEQRKDEAIRLVGDEVYRTWKLYMSASIYAFETANISVSQSLLAKPADGAAGLPFSRADLYKKEYSSCTINHSNGASGSDPKRVW